MKSESVSHSVVSNSLQIPWTVARQTPLFMGFSRQEYWSGLPFPSPGDLPDSGTKPGSPELQADSLPLESPGKPHIIYIYIYKIYTCSWGRKESTRLRD